MNRNFFVLLTFIILLGFEVSAQIKKANTLFESYNYSQAIPYYLKIAQNAGDRDQNEAIVKLADCYRLTHDQLNAKKWYAQAVNLPETDPINWFYYGESLRSFQDYELAKEAYDKYAELASFDPKGKAYSGFCANVEKITDLPSAFEVKNAKNLNTEYSDFGPVFYGEGIIYVSDRTKPLVGNKKSEPANLNNLDLFFARPRYLDEFYQDMNGPKSFAGLFNQTFIDGSAAFAKHDSLIYFTRNERRIDNDDAANSIKDKLKIYWAAKIDTWSNPEPFFLNSDSYSVAHPSLSPDCKIIYFESDMPGGFGGTDIYSCEWKNNQWSQPKNLGKKVNSVGNEMFPSINGNKLYFSSDGWPGFGGLDLFCSTLDNGSWSKSENLGLPLNSSYNDFSLVLDAQGKKGFFSSNRPGGFGNDDIYACKRLENNSKLRDGILYGFSLKVDSVTISGSVKDKLTMKPIPGSVVFLVNTVKGKAKVLRTDANGQFRSSVEKGVVYLAKGMDNKYLSDCLSFEIRSDDTIHKAKTPRDLLLDQLVLNKVFTFNNTNLDLENIYFDFGKWNIRPDAQVELDKLVQLMKENPLRIELGSHTDSRGSAEYNKELSQKRAESVVHYIVQQGIERSRITAKGYGEANLTNNCSDGVPCSPAEHQANRRTEFKVTGFNNPTETGNGFDLGKFKAEDEIPVYMFEKDFFIYCLQNKPIAESSKASLQTGQQQEAAKGQGTKVQTSDPAKVAAKSTQPAEQLKPKVKDNQPSEAVIKPVKDIKQADIVKANPVMPIVIPTEEQVTTSIPETQSITYRVQLFALSKPILLNSPEFDNLKDIQRYEEDGLYKYTSGTFETYEEAHAYREKIVNDGYTGSFVVKFEDGKHVNIALVNK
jgi:outer membrane protein OmpA-like peptidoglycan-associated protein/tetratricopeptide (TPR) repeat protein